MSATDEPDDRTLLHEFCAARSELAFTALVNRYLPLVFHAALRRLGSAALAEEAAQSAFSRLAAKAAAVARHPERLRAWLCRTAYLEACKLARRETRLSRLPIIPEPDPEPMNRPEIYDRLDDALNRLPELDRELVLRHCCDGEEYRDIAAAVGKSAAACQKRVERALAVLGRGLGGAKTAGVALAAFAASNAESPALPSAEQIAAAALQQSAAGSGAAGALSGLKIAACVALALAGGAAGWQRQAAPPTPPEIVRSAARSRAEPSAANASPQTPVLAPRPSPSNHTLDEILESIQTGRFGPLVEFLPEASVADLRAIIAEDDFYEFGEVDGKNHFGTARNLALLRWAEIDPEGAFRFGNARDQEQRGYFLGDTAAVIGKWLLADPTAAAKAFGALPTRSRVELAQQVFAMNPAAADQLAAAFPAVAWVVRKEQFVHAREVKTPEDAERLLAIFFAGGRQAPPTDEEWGAFFGIFEILAKQDPEGTIARAKNLPWPSHRSALLNRLYQDHPQAAIGLPPGALRTQAVANEAAQLMATDPEAVIRKLRAAAPGEERNALFTAVAQTLAGGDPWRLLEITRATRGCLVIHSGDLHRALEFAGKTDPQRALALLPDLAAHTESYGGAKDLAEAILIGWLKKDPAAASQMAAKLGIRLDASTHGNYSN